MFMTLALSVCAALAPQAQSSTPIDLKREHLTYVLARTPSHALLRVDNGTITKIDFTGTVVVFGSSQKYIALVTQTRDGFRFRQYDSRTGNFIREVALPADCLVTGDLSGPIEGIVLDDASSSACFLALFSTPTTRTAVIEVNLGTGALENTTIPSKTRGAAGLFDIPKPRIGIYYVEDHDGIRVIGKFDVKTNTYADLFPVGLAKQDSQCLFVPTVGVFRADTHLTSPGALVRFSDASLNPLPAPTTHTFTVPIRSPQNMTLNGNSLIVFGEAVDKTGINAIVGFNPLTATQAFRTPLPFTARKFRLTDQKQDVVFLDRDNPAVVDYSVSGNTFGARVEFAPGIRPLNIVFSR